MALSPPNEGLGWVRPPGWRFNSAGVNLRELPDALPPSKFASLKNVRSTQTQGLQTRPGYTFLFSTGGLSVTDIRAYDTVNPSVFAIRFLARDANNQIWLDNGTLVASLDNTNPTFGVTMLPFRPAESPQSWMYIGSPADYQKISAPDPVTGLCTAYKVGIAEPQVQVEAAPGDIVFQSTVLAGFVAGGTASGTAFPARSTDTAGVVIADTALATRYSVQVGALAQYQIGEQVTFVNTGVSFPVAVQDVLPPLAATQITAIYYKAGTTGYCTIVPAQGTYGDTGSNLVGSLRRGALVQIDSEICMVFNSVTGPDGAVCFDTSTASNHSPGASIVGVPAIVVEPNGNPGTIPIAGQTINVGSVQVSQAPGIGTLSQTYLTTPFGTISLAGQLLEDQYIHISVQVSDPTQLQQINLIFNIDSESVPSYSKNYFYYALQPSLFGPVNTNAQTLLDAVLTELTQTTLPDGTPIPPQVTPGTNQWTSLYIPVTSLVRMGGDQTRTLNNCNGIQFNIDTTGAAGNITVSVSDLYIWVNGQPDTGDDGVNYNYRVVPLNSTTGVRGNPSPPMRYGVRPRSQTVALTLPSASYDPQIDTWEIERYGGSVTSYRYIGSTPSTSTAYIDNADNQAASGGTLMQTDNFEPWPSVDVPWRVTAAQATITVVGTKLVVSGYTTWPTTINRWLPGTLIQLGGQQAFTLRNRPVALSSSSYLFDLQECVSPQIAPSYVWILEPKVARQCTTFIFGPDVNGTFFAVNDHLRPGTLLYSKQYNPDSAPDSYNLDLCPPSEVLITGFVKGGVALVASEKRWWALYPQFSNAAQRYNPVEQAVGRGIAAPLGYFTDGATVWFWAKDGIASTDGGPHSSLTDADLYPIFPHEGIPGVNITRNGVTYYAPDYSNSGTFRLNKVNTYLFADYQDTTGTPRTLVCDLRTGGWSTDVYADQITLHYNNDLQTPPQCLLSDAAGRVYQELDCAGDASVKIDCLVATFEWDGGDLRASPLFGDSYLDCVPQSAITAQPVSQGVAICAPTTIATTGSRALAVVSVQGGELQKFMGCVYTWSD